VKQVVKLLESPLDKSEQAAALQKYAKGSKLESNLKQKQ